MGRKLSVSAALVLLLIGALITFQITYSYVGYKYQDKLDEITENRLVFSKLAAVDELVRSQYVGSIDEEELALAQWHDRNAIAVEDDGISLTREMIRVFKEGREPR